MEMNESFWKFVEMNLKGEPAGLRLKYHGKEMGFDMELAITQIECRRKFGKKLAETLGENPHFLFPSVLAGEQATSDLLAAYHAQLAGADKRIIDLTAGLGIDALHLAARNTVTAVEKDPDKAAALSLNSHGTIEVKNEMCEDVIAQAADSGQKFDLAFIDPARRDASGGRLFALADCQPDVCALQPAIHRIADQLIVKASPMLDITMMANSLQGLKEIIALGTPTECKELVAICERGYQGDYHVSAVTLAPHPIDFCFTTDEEKAARANYSLPQPGAYIFEPYPAVMKAAPYNMLAQHYGIEKLHPNTHLYWGKEMAQAEMPGHKYRILKVLPYESRHIKRLSKEYPAMQVATRNFDLPAEALRKKLKVKDGDQVRLYAVTVADGSKAMIITEPID